MATRIKSKALDAPRNRGECSAAIRTLGDVQRESARVRAAMNDAIAEITHAHQPLLEELGERVSALQAGIQAWCEANRITLCGEDDRLGKTVNLVTGEVAWRQRPPSVQIRGAEGVLAALVRKGLERFIRTKHEPNKEAILAEPAAVRAVAGITVVSGVEDFIVTPFEVSAEGAAA